MRRSGRGFTLIEVLVVLAVMSIATGIGATVFHQAMDKWSEIRTSAELQNTAERIFDAMRQDLADVASANVSGVALKSSQPIALPGGAQLDMDEVTIPVVAAASGGGVLDVTYRVFRKEDGSCGLARIVGNTKHAPDDSGFMANGVLGMRCEFLPNGADAQWRQNWEEPALPAAMRVSLLLSAPDRPYQKIARKAVFPIRVD